MREIYRLGERERGEVQERRRILDRTKYGRTRAGPKDFVNFHAQGLSMVAVKW